MKKFLYTILTASIATACSLGDSLETVNTVHVPVSKETLKTLPVLPLKKSEVALVTGFSKHGNTIVLGQYNATHQAVSINLQTQARENILPFERSRKARNRMIAVGMNSNEQLTTFDIHTGQLSEASSPGTRSGAAELTTIQLPKGKKHLRAERAGRFVIATGLYEEGRYLLYSPEDGTAEYQLSYPSHPSYPDITEKTKGILYASTVLRVHPSNQAFVCADMYSGNIEFCRIVGNSIQQVSAHCYHHPKVYIKEKKCDVSYSRDNRFGFTDITVSDSRVYAIYSGKTYREATKKFQHCRKLFVYDWNGNLQNSYDLDTELTNISYDSAENAIYGLAQSPAPGLVKLAL